MSSKHATKKNTWRQKTVAFCFPAGCFLLLLRNHGGLFTSLFEMLPHFDGFFFIGLRSIRELHDARQLAPSSHVACGARGPPWGWGFWIRVTEVQKKKWRACWWIFLSFDYVQLLFSVHLIVYLAIDFLTFINFVPLDSHDSGIDHQGWPP